MLKSAPWIVPALMTVCVLSPLSMQKVAAEEPKTVGEELQQVEDRQVKVWARKDVTIVSQFGADEGDVKSRELWYSGFDGSKWSDWNKHGLTYGQSQQVVWAPSEGHWRIYVRKTLKSGLSMPAPEANTKGHAEFIIDRTAPEVAVTFPTNGAKLRGGGKYTVTWNTTDKYLKGAPITIQYSRDGKGNWDAIATDVPNTGTYEWTTPRDMTTAGQLRILVADKAGNVGNGASTGLLVDSVNPSGSITGPEISNAMDVNVQVQVGDVGPAGLSEARLWVSQDNGSSWAEGPFITDPFTSVPWKATTDGKFRLFIVATDQAGNKTPLPKGKADDQFLLTVDTTAPSIKLSSAIGVVEADKAASERRAFKPGDRVAVPFAISDANLQPNSVSVWIQTDPAKPWSELGKGLPTDSAFRFDIPATGTKNARIRVTATDLAGNVGEVISVETFQIDIKVGEDVIDLK